MSVDEPEDEVAEELEEGALDPDEVDPLLDPWDPGSDDELYRRRVRLTPPARPAGAARAARGAPA